MSAGRVALQRDACRASLTHSIRRVIRKLWEKLRSLYSGASERMTQERAEQQGEAEELKPGHSDQAGQIGMFS